MYTVSVALFSGYILIPLLLSNIVTLINPFMPPAYLLFLQQGYTLLTWIIIFGTFAYRYPGFLSLIGLQFNKKPGYYLWESLLLMILVVGMTLLLNVFWQYLGMDVKSLAPYQHYSIFQLKVLSVFAVLVAPLQEELIFRGLVQTTFHKVSPPLRAVLFTGLVFTLLHGSYSSHLPALAHVMIIGLCFGFWKERTGSLVPGIMVHLFNNVMASIMMLKQI